MEASSLALASVVFAGLGYASRRRRRRERVLGGLMLCVLLFSLRLNSAFVAKYWSGPRQDRVFLLAGQSNMAGRGGLVKKKGQVRKVFDPLLLQHQFERDLVVADGRVERLTADMRWIPATEPMHVDIDSSKSCGIGPGLMFARMIGGGPSRLIPCAVGGTRMDEWAQDSPLYQAMLKRARFANAPIDALVWYQGESDGLLPTDADGFLDKLVDLTVRVRRDLNQPELLILVVNIWASVERCPLRDDIRYAIAQLPLLVRHVHVVDAQHSALLDDNIHLTSLAQHRVATLLARAFVVATNTQ